MRKYGPALLLAYAVVFPACPQARAASRCGQKATGRTVSPALNDSYITADAGDKVDISTHAALGSLRADAKSRHLLAPNLLILFHFEGMRPNNTYFTGMGTLNLNDGDPTATIEVVDWGGSSEGSLNLRLLPNVGSRNS